MKNNSKFKYNKANEVVKYKFFNVLRHSGINGKNPYDEKTVKQYSNAIHEFEVATGVKDFKKFNLDWAISFKSYLLNKKNKRTGEEVSKTLFYHYIVYVRTFLVWLAENNEEYVSLKVADINYLKTNNNDKRIAMASSYQESYKLGDILSTIRKMPSNTIIEMRNKAMLSLCLLTTPRISALKTARLCSIKYLNDYDIYAFIQDPKLVQTKFAKTITSCFIGQSQDIIDNVLNWKSYLEKQGFKGKGYLFPKIIASFNKDGQSILELKKDGLESDSGIRETIFKPAFKANGLKYLRPHSFRHTVARAMKKMPNAVELSIALAENDGHKVGMSTLHCRYGGDYIGDQARLMKGFKLE